MTQLWTAIFAPGLFSQSFMANAWEASTMVALISGMVGFFVILRGSSFVAHALPKGGFAGAAGAVLFGVNTVLGLTIFTVGGALSIGLLGKKGRHDVVTALTLVFLLGVGDLFLNLSNVYAPEVFALLFGEVLGVSSGELVDTAVLGGICLVAFLILYRPLLLSSIAPDTAEARGIRVHRLEVSFLVVIGLATAITVPIVGALLTFSLMVGPAAAACHLARRPSRALALSVLFSLITMWLSLFFAYDTGWPVGFFVSALAALLYVIARIRKRETLR
jgi:zinc/manganese transport system permease protein